MINVQDMTFGYSKQSLLFNDLNMQLTPGSITGLLGKNGAGKTTFLKLLTGLRSPLSGKIKVFDKRPDKREVELLANTFFVPEEFSMPPITIRQYIKANGQFYPTFDYAMIDRILKDFELDETKKINKLSYGQKKKFLISFALSTRCSLLVLDEPTNGLDIPSKSLFRKIMAGALDEHQLVLISTHQVKDVENLIDQIIILDQGKVIFQSSTQRISEKLTFRAVTSPNGEHVVYSEAVPGGYKAIMSQHDNGGETEIDIELLFNAVTNGKKLLTDVTIK